MVQVVLFGKTQNLSDASIRYYTDTLGYTLTRIDGDVTLLSPDQIQRYKDYVAQGPDASTIAGPVGSVLGIGGKVSGQLAKVFSKPVTAGTIAGTGGAVAGQGLGKAGTIASAPLQGFGFGAGYGTGVRAGYELGFPSIFGEEKSEKRRQIVQSGFEGLPFFDILRGLSGGGDLGLKVGNGYRSDEAGEAPADFLVGNPPEPDRFNEGLGFSDALEVTLSGPSNPNQTLQQEFARLQRVSEKIIKKYGNLQRAKRQPEWIENKQRRQELKAALLKFGKNYLLKNL